MDILSSRVLIRPTDPERSHRFYRDTLGLAIYREFPGGIVFFIGGGHLEVSGHTPGTQPAGPHVELWLQVRDLAATEADLRAAGVTILRGRELEPWGLEELWIADPDGVRIVVVEVPEDHPLRRR
jgi:catechol 2,3-dioxygenase-like lactoylglutathione lyase family enzyme